MTTLAPPAHSVPAPSRNGTADPGPLQAAHTANFPALLRQLGASLLVTTYQAGKLVLVRDQGNHLISSPRLPSPSTTVARDRSRPGRASSEPGPTNPGNSPREERS